MFYDTNEATGWKLAGTMYVNEVKEAAQPVLDLTMIILAAAIVIGGIAIYFIIKSIRKPLIELSESAEKISQGILPSILRCAHMMKSANLHRALTICRQS